MITQTGPSPTLPRQREQWCTLCWRWGSHSTASHLATQRVQQHTDEVHHSR